MLHLLASLWRTHVTEVAARLNAESRAYLAATPVARADREAATVALTGLAGLIFINFFGRPGHLEVYQELLGALHLGTWADRLQGYLVNGFEGRIHQRIFWSVTRALGYVGIPALVIWRVLRGSVVDYGFRIRGILPHGRIYGAMFLAIAPAVIAASFTTPFQQTYPFYRLNPGEPLWPRLWLWELLYASQFVALEFFFRGFLLHGLKRRFGYSAVWVMIIPYVMIHFDKPFAECLGAIAAGFVLGTLSLQTGSMWWGAAIHTAVAWGMDLLSLGHQGRL
jgi:uncharacterized protein